MDYKIGYVIFTDVKKCSSNPCIVVVGVCVPQESRQCKHKILYVTLKTTMKTKIIMLSIN